MNVRQRHPKLLGHDLRQHSFVPLPLRRSTRLHGDAAIILYRDAHALERSEPRTLDIGANPNTDIAPFLARTFLPLREVGIARQCRGFVERSRIIAAVVNDGLSVAEREL